MKPLCGLLLSLLLISLGFPQRSVAYNEPSSEWPLCEVKFEGIATLKNLFDGGLRPYWFPGSENSSLAQKKTRLKFYHPGGIETPEFPALYYNVGINFDSRILTLEASTRPIPIAAAREMISLWVPHSIRFDADKLEEVTTMLEASDGKLPETFVGFFLFGAPLKLNKVEGFSEQPSHSISLRYSFDPKNPIILDYNASWSRMIPRGQFKSNDLPLRPPPGYEHLSMRTPRNFGPTEDDPIYGDGPGFPAHYYPAQRDGATTEASAPIKPGPPSDPHMPPPATPGFSGWWKWLLVALAVLLLGRQMWKLRKTG